VAKWIDVLSIHLRPPEIIKREMPGHWEGDLIKGKNNASTVGTLVELISGYLILAKMGDATATSAVAGFSDALNRLPATARKSMTYDQGRKMAQQAKITQEIGVAIYFCDPHSPWQRGPMRISMALSVNIYRKEQTFQYIARKSWMPLPWS